jgi:ABC-type phosphonate transport system ATPase subunit
MSLEIQGIRKTFGAFTAVDDVSFVAERGQIFGFLGTNGAGKTTTMRIILDILRPDTGRVLWEGQTRAVGGRALGGDHGREHRPLHWGRGAHLPDRRPALRHATEPAHPLQSRPRAGGTLGDHWE